MSEDQVGIKLGEIGVWRGGGTPSKSNPKFWTGSVPWVSPKDMKSTEIADSIDHISVEAITESATQLIPAESIIMVTRSGILDHSFPVAITKRDVTINQDLKAVSLHDGIEPRYAMLALKAFGRSILDDCAKEGTTVASVEFDRLKSFEIPLAPLPEQRRIVAKLDALQSRTRIAREALDAVAPLLKSFRQSVLQAAVTGALTEEWRGHRTIDEWETVTLGEVIFEMRNGLSPKPSEQPPGTKILRISALRPGIVDISDCRYLTVSDSTMRIYSLVQGDLLFTRYNGTLEFVGVCGVVPELSEPLLYPDKLIRVKVDPSKIISSFIEIAFGSSSVRTQIEDFIKSSAGQKGISGGDLKTVEFPLPPLAEQAEIVRRVQHLFAIADAMEVEFAAAQRSVDQLDQSLLATAFRGELVPQDLSDEPASVLLERIRAARAAAPDSKGKRGRKASSEFDSGTLMAAETAAPKKRGRPQKG